ncbi:MAG: hypothetical protein AAFZ07_20000 [Actinomycetota bacterium]
MTDIDPFGPFDASTPNPAPNLPAEWFRCARFSPISGRYAGPRTDPRSGRRIELRIDVDPRYRNSPVLDVISGDVFDHHEFNWFGRSWTWSVHRFSWVAQDVDVDWGECAAVVTGTARRHDTGQLVPVTVTVRWTAGRITTTTCELGGDRYTCTREGHAFRTLDLEIDVCDSVNAEPVEAAYDVTWHANRPAELPERVLTIEESFAEAGVEVRVNAPADRTVIDDSAAEFDSWSAEELHDAMETHYSRWRGTWPDWRMWLLVAGTYDRASVGGIMFDYAAPGEPPERQGCAMFRNHWWWNQLVDGIPATEAQAVAHRKWLHTYVHEVGHGFNMKHSWDMGRPSDRSWMNYDWKYDQINGAGSYYRDFEFRFGDEELRHLRHGDRRSVIPGGDAWGSGVYAEEPEAIGELVGRAPLELIVRSKQLFEFLEPVKLELRVRNLVDLDVEIDARLGPEDGTVELQIRRPDGRVVGHHTPMCRLGEPEAHVLVDPQRGEKGLDRLSAELLVGVGADGLYFDEPGTYVVRAVYHGPGGMTVPSAAHRFRVAAPRTRRDETLAGNLFSRDVGLALYLGGSASPHLETAMGHLRDASEELASSAAGAQISACIAPTFTRPRFRVEDGALVRTRPAEPDTALELMDRALSADQKRGDALTPITQHYLSRQRAETMAGAGKKTEAKRALRSLKKSLAAQGVNKPVLEDLDAFIKAL